VGNGQCLIVNLNGAALLTEVTIYGTLNVQSAVLNISNVLIIGNTTVGISIITFLNGSISTIGGTLILRDSSVVFEGENQIVIGGSFDIVNGHIIMSSTSNISVQGCPNFTNTTLTVYDTSTNTNSRILPLMQYNSNCSLTPFTNINVISSQSCKKIVSETYYQSSNVFGLQLTYDSSSCDSSGTPIWVIAVICLATVILLSVIVVVIVRFESIRKYIFPYRDLPPEYLARQY